MTFLSQYSILLSKGCILELITPKMNKEILMHAVLIIVQQKPLDLPVYSSVICNFEMIYITTIKIKQLCS